MGNYSKWRHLPHRGVLKYLIGVSLSNPNNQSAFGIMKIARTGVFLLCLICARNISLGREQMDAGVRPADRSLVREFEVTFETSPSYAAIMRNIKAASTLDNCRDRVYLQYVWAYVLLWVTAQIEPPCDTASTEEALNQLMSAMDGIVQSVSDSDYLSPELLSSSSGDIVNGIEAWQKAKISAPINGTFTASVTPEITSKPAKPLAESVHARAQNLKSLLVPGSISYCDNQSSAEYRRRAFSELVCSTDKRSFGNAVDLLFCEAEMSEAAHDVFFRSFIWSTVQFWIAARNCDGPLGVNERGIIARSVHSIYFISLFGVTTPDGPSQDEINLMVATAAVDVLEAVKILKSKESDAAYHSAQPAAHGARNPFDLNSFWGFAGIVIAAIAAISLWLVQQRKKLRSVRGGSIRSEQDPT